VGVGDRDEVLSLDYGVISVECLWTVESGQWSVGQ